jgi:hypothetical protein
MRQDGNLKVIRESVKTSKHTKLQFQLNTNLQIFIYLFIYLLETPDISFRVKPKSAKFPSKFVKHFKKFLSKFWRAPYIHEYPSSKLSDIASTCQEWTFKGGMLIAYSLGVWGILCLQSQVPTYQYRCLVLSIGQHYILHFHYLSTLATLTQVCRRIN